ncbi:MAG TPA: hypothetical protein VHF58_02915 [Solirubrobacterales bacterium]|nr:hypothetical protein [Solirubrobacterales bacterium]
MRAMTITTRYKQIRHSGRLVIAVAVVAGALIAPAGASAVADYPVSNEHASSQGSGEFSSVTALAPPQSQPSAPQSAPEYSTVSSITGSDVGNPQPLTVSSPSADDGFDWSDAGIGALVALALSLCAAASVHVARRRTTLSPSA